MFKLGFFGIKIIKYLTNLLSFLFKENMNCLIMLIIGVVIEVFFLWL